MLFGRRSQPRFTQQVRGEKGVSRVHNNELWAPMIGSLMYMTVYFVAMVTYALHVVNCLVA